MRKYSELDNHDCMKNCDLPTSSEMFGARMFSSLKVGALSSQITSVEGYFPSVILLQKLGVNCLPTLCAGVAVLNCRRCNR